MTEVFNLNYKSPWRMWTEHAKNCIFLTSNGRDMVYMLIFKVENTLLYIIYVSLLSKCSVFSFQRYMHCKCYNPGVCPQWVVSSTQSIPFSIQTTSRLWWGLQHGTEPQEPPNILLRLLHSKLDLFTTILSGYVILLTIPFMSTHFNF